MNRFRTLLIATAVAAAASATPAIARDDVSFSLTVGPPPPRVEHYQPRPGYVYAPGYWKWNGKKYGWQKGRYMRERHNERWVADSWNQRDGRWYYQRGYWSH